MQNKISLHLDNIIYQLQGTGGISTYWTELSSMISASQVFQIHHTTGSKITRYSPVYTNAQIFHSSYYRIPLSKHTKKVVTIHDFIYQYGFIKSLNTPLNIFQMKLAINTADAIVCVSENTKKDLLLLYPHLKKYDKIYVVGNGVSLKFEETLNIKAPTRLREISRTIVHKYILFVGKRIEYKNFEAALLGFFESSLPKNGFSMICIGSKFSDSEYEQFAKLGLTNNIAFFENATDSELNYLYQNAFALVYPSLYEGFGLPPLEAMSCGCPVIASNTSSIPEVVGDAGILIDPNDIKAIASALESLLSNEIRNNYINKGFERAKLFSWQKIAQQYIEIYQSLVTPKN